MARQIRILSNLRVLVVDDRSEITSLIGEILTDHGAFVISTNDGAEAMDLTRRLGFDLMILDLRMSQPDGFRVIEFLTATDPDLLRHTLVLTGLTHDRDAADLLSKLHIPCLFKPFQVEDLVRVASRVSEKGPTSRPAA